MVNDMCIFTVTMYNLMFVVPAFSVTVTSTDSLQGAVVGDTLDIQCTAEAFNGVESSSVVFVWLGPEGIIRNDSRVTISPTNSFLNTFNSTLHFSYLMEGDKGMYRCNVTILRARQSDSIELGRLNSKSHDCDVLILYVITVPTPNVSVTTYNATVVGQPLILECNVIAVRGINSQVVIVWSSTNSNEELRIVNVNASTANNCSVIYRDYFNISQLTVDYNDVTYECKVTINDVIATDNFTLYVTGKYLSCIDHNNAYVFYAVPNFNIHILPIGSLQGAVVGDKQTIHCIINTVSGITLNSVIVKWIDPSGVSLTNSSRITISQVTVGSSNNNSINSFTSSLDFMYLMEGDEGTYRCDVTILQTNASVKFEVGALLGRQ